MIGTLFFDACLGREVSRVPVWLMRQAGRYMPEYQALRSDVDFLGLCRRPDLAARATLDAVRYLDTDAAIIFSDITIPADAMGLGLSFAPGPRFARPVRTGADVDRLRTVEPERDLDFVLEAIRIVRRELASDVSLIGFVGAPLTLAGYMVEGEPTSQWMNLKSLLYGQPGVAHALLERVSDVVAAHAAAQVRAGCDAIQLFDTTAGELAAAELETFAFSYSRRVIEQLLPLGVPVIYFARHIGAHLEAAAALGEHVLGLDWTVPVAEARRRVGDRITLMGNLDPSVLLTNRQEIDNRVREILAAAGGPFVFNLGHGVLPPTPPENARQVVESVKAHGARP
jgi:uroporphyrinogen decarboxylase